ncbi:MAG: adenylate kinase family protein, partial [Candidatus Saccharimonadales bacterium]
MILLMGLPGAGKGTQGKIMADQHGMHLVSMGEIIRMYVTGERRIGMLSGELLDDNEVIELLDQVLSGIASKDLCVLDGFPRTIAQAEWLVDKAQKENFKISYVIHLAANEGTVKDRLRARGRLDDREDVIVERFKEYNQLTLPLIKWFKEHNIKVIEINAERTVDEVND